MAHTTVAPVRKITVGALGGALVTFIVGVLNTYHPFFITTPISAEIAGAATTMVTFCLAYFTPPDPNETTIRDKTGRVRTATTRTTATTS